MARQGYLRARGLRAERSDERRESCSRSEIPGSQRASGITAGSSRCRRRGRIRRPAVCAARPQIQRHLGRDLQRRRRSARRIERDAASSRNFKTSQRRHDVDNAGPSGPGSIGRGATLAQRCAICHGPQGSATPTRRISPGNMPAVIYKELHDFKSGARVNAVMTPFAANISDQDMLDLAAYYSYLPRFRRITRSPQLRPLALSSNGAPLRKSRPAAPAMASSTTRPAALAGGAIRGLHQGATAGVRFRHAPQRHQPANAQHRAPDDTWGN